MAANGPPCSDDRRASSGTDTCARRFPAGHGARRSLSHPRLRTRARRLRAGQHAVRGQLRDERRNDRAERRWRGRDICLRRVPRPARRRRRRWRRASRGHRRRLPRTAADRLCRRAAGRSADELYRGQAEASRAPRGCRVLCRAGTAATAPDRRLARCGRAHLSFRGTIARPALVRIVPWRTRRRYRAREPTAGGPAGRLSRCSTRPLARFEPQKRSGRRDVADQPVAQSVRSRGSRGSCGRSSWGSSQSGTSGSIPRSTS